MIGLDIEQGPTTGSTEFTDVVRGTIREIGYNRAKFGFDFETCGTVVSVKEQSADIKQGVDATNLEDSGAGDQDKRIVRG